MLIQKCFGKYKPGLPGRKRNKNCEEEKKVIPVRRVSEKQRRIDSKHRKKFFKKRSILFEKKSKPNFVTHMKKKVQLLETYQVGFSRIISVEEEENAVTKVQVNC